MLLSWSFFFKSPLVCAFNLDVLLDGFTDALLSIYCFYWIFFFSFTCIWFPNIYIVFHVLGTSVSDLNQYLFVTTQGFDWICTFLFLTFKPHWRVPTLDAACISSFNKWRSLKMDGMRMLVLVTVLHFGLCILGRTKRPFMSVLFALSNIYSYVMGQILETRELTKNEKTSRWNEK